MIKRAFQLKARVDQIKVERTDFPFGEKNKAKVSTFHIPQTKINAIRIKDLIIKTKP